MWIKSELISYFLHFYNDKLFSYNKVDNIFNCTWINYNINVIYCYMLYFLKEKYPKKIANSNDLVN